MARCPDPCGKTRYGSEAIAQLACIRAAMNGKSSLTWYRAGRCHCWHLTSSRQGGRRTRWIHRFTPSQ